MIFLERLTEIDRVLIDGIIVLPTSQQCACCLIKAVLSDT